MAVSFIGGGKWNQIQSNWIAMNLYISPIPEPKLQVFKKSHSKFIKIKSKSVALAFLVKHVAFFIMCFFGD